MTVASLFVDLLTPALGLALTPLAVTGGIVLLSSSRPVANDLAFMLPFVVVYGLLSVAVIVAAGASDDALVGERTKDAIALGIGVLLLGLAVGTWLHTRRARRREERKSGLLDRVAGARPATAAGLGLTIAVLSPNLPILFGGLALIARVDPPVAEQLAGAAMLVGASVVGLVVPLLWYLFRPGQAARGLARLRVWLGRNEDTLNVVVLLLFGAIFAVTGLRGLV